MDWEWERGTEKEREGLGKREGPWERDWRARGKGSERESAIEEKDKKGGKKQGNICLTSGLRYDIEQRHIFVVFYFVLGVVVTVIAA